MLTIAQDTHLYTHAAVRLNPPDTTESGEAWKATLLTRNQSFRVSPAVAFILAAFMGGHTVQDVMSDVCQHAIGDPESALAAVGWLRDAGLLVGGEDPEHQWAEHIMRSWGKYEWNATADHHLATFDYPFIDYSRPGAVAADQQRMDAYEAEEPDLARTKRYADPSHSLPAPTAPDVLRSLDESFADVWHRFCSPPRPSGAAPKPVTVDHLLQIMAATFGQLRIRPVSRSGQRRDLIRKTSPSGGARHPTEAYVAAVNVDDMAPGLYHFCVQTNTLDLIRELPPLERLELLFEGPFRARQEQGVEPAAILIMTSVFDRVMWRYREPRTFRTLFMDIGHLTTTFNVMAAAFGYTCYFQHGLIDGDIERLLGADHLTESVIFGASIGVPGTSPEWKLLRRE